MKKEIKIKEFSSRKKLLEEIVKNDDVILTGTINELKALKVDQGSNIGATIVPEPEIIKAGDFKERQELDDYVKDLLGDNLTLNKINSHTIEGTKKELDKLFLSETSTIYGCKIKINE